MIKKPLKNNGKEDEEYSMMLKTVVNHLRVQGYDLKVNNGKIKLRPKILKGFLPAVHAFKGSDEIIIEIETSKSRLDLKKWRRFAYNYGTRFWIVADYAIADHVRHCARVFDIPAEVYTCNGTMRLERVL